MVGTFSLFWLGTVTDAGLALSLALMVSTGEVGCETFAVAGSGFLTIFRSVLVDSMLPLPAASFLWAFADAAIASSDGVSRWM